MQSQNDYLRQWVPRQESYLHHLLDREAPPEDRRCVVCNVLSLGSTYYCQGMNYLMRTPSWKYTRSFVTDSNFEAEHLHPIKPFDEVWLADGLGFIVGKDRYKAHLAEAADTLEKSSCNNHRAVNQANAA
ncbi:uncharacterized protein EDB93DRAFT_1107960 [Suillus bovinus]|uniref:uncharacterized protein n=1 Tax=Suillus bovinus TaxID=48563 RepID=UPI001B8729A6|nr:uncharacterized protein EDB93DRAFT_1107960 [Suillus bovinus]KAG2132124.1 hypothetical protein EDB93DRAFT_1107960 [Suillus bovinus]